MSDTLELPDIQVQANPKWQHRDKYIIHCKWHMRQSTQMDTFDLVVDKNRLTDSLMQLYFMHILATWSSSSISLLSVALEKRLSANNDYPFFDWFYNKSYFDPTSLHSIAVTYIDKSGLELQTNFKSDTTGSEISRFIKNKFYDTNQWMKSVAGPINEFLDYIEVDLVCTEEKKYLQSTLNQPQAAANKNLVKI